MTEVKCEWIFFFIFIFQLQYQQETYLEKKMYKIQELSLIWMWECLIGKHFHDTMMRSNWHVTHFVHVHIYTQNWKFFFLQHTWKTSEWKYKTVECHSTVFPSSLIAFPFPYLHILTHSKKNDNQRTSWQMESYWWLWCTFLWNVCINFLTVCGVLWKEVYHTQKKREEKRKGWKTW